MFPCFTSTTFLYVGQDRKMLYSAKAHVTQFLAQFSHPCLNDCQISHSFPSFTTDRDGDELSLSSVSLVSVPGLHFSSNPQKVSKPTTTVCYTVVVRLSHRYSFDTLHSPSGVPECLFMKPDYRHGSCRQRWQSCHRPQILTINRLTPSGFFTFHQV